MTAAISARSVDVEQSLPSGSTRYSSSSGESKFFSGDGSGREGRAEEREILVFGWVLGTSFPSRNFSFP